MNTYRLRQSMHRSSISPATHVGYLDGWRGIAIALVLESHFIGVLPFETGRMGVDVFFGLSGFLMSGLLFIKRQPLSVFYKRRISRILPAFWLFVGCIYGYAFVRHFNFGLTDVASTFLFFRTYLPVGTGIWETGIPIGHLWSINVEEHCYIFMSLIVLIRRYRGHEGLVLFLCGLLCVGVGLVYVRMGNSAPQWGVLGTEVAASHILVSSGYRLMREKYHLKVPSYLPLVAVIVVPACYSKLAPWWAASVISPFLLAFAVNHLGETYDWVKSVLSVQVLRYLGIWSFSIYLWQQPFYIYKHEFSNGPLAALAAAFAASLVCFYVWEQPIRFWLNKHW